MLITRLNRVARSTRGLLNVLAQITDKDEGIPPASQG
jgi:hypothetical protein